jgi:hypothetical protein
LEGIIVNTAAQNSPAQPPAADPLLTEATALTLHDYQEPLDAIPAEPAAGQAGVLAERIGAEIQSDPRLAPLVDSRPEFVNWAIQQAAADRNKQVSEVSADEAREALQEPRRKLVRHLLDALSRNGPEPPGYVRTALQALLDDPRPWAGGVGRFIRAAVGDLYAAHRVDVDVLKEAHDHGLPPFEVLAILQRARLQLSEDPDWRAYADSRRQQKGLRTAFESQLAAAERGEAKAAGSADAGPGMAGGPCPPPAAVQVYPPCGCAVSDISLDKPPFPTAMMWAGQTDPCQSVDYLRYLVRIYTIGETGQLFLAGERLADRWAEATNWCGPEMQAAPGTDCMACRQSLDDLLYCLRRRSAETDTAYATRAGLYQAQLESPALQQAWADFVAQVDSYLASSRTGEGRDAPYRCIGIYTAAEALRRAAAAQLTGLARMQIKELACWFQTVWQLFTDPRVAQIIHPLADSTLGTGSLAADCQAAQQAAVVFEVVRQLLGADGTGLYQAWDKAIRLDQVFSWVQSGQQWSPKSRCEEDEAFVDLLGAMSALNPGIGSTPLTPAPSQTAGTLTG